MRATVPRVLRERDHQREDTRVGKRPATSCRRRSGQGGRNGTVRGLHPEELRRRIADMVTAMVASRRYQRRPRSGSRRRCHPSASGPGQSWSSQRGAEARVSAADSEGNSSRPGAHRAGGRTDILGAIFHLRDTDGDDFVISGQKIYITGAHVAALPERPVRHHRP